MAGMARGDRVGANAAFHRCSRNGTSVLIVNSLKKRKSHKHRNEMFITGMNISSLFESENKLRKIMPPRLALLCLLGMIALYWISPAKLISSWVFLIFGLGFMTLGIVIAISAEDQFRRSHTTVDHLGLPTRLVTDGWFKHNRNPMYLSFALLLMGASLVLGSVSSLIGVIVYLFITQRWYIV